ncbi:MAG: nucleoside-triphosphatase [Pelolinea sp.]|nr:nucleoside-triphosphatase [Pelolinea sp.]
MDFTLGRINLVTGKREVGKSNFCADLVRELKKMDHSVSGIISPGTYKENKKIGIFSQNISNGERIELAHYSPGWDPENPQRVWKINLNAVHWGNSILRKMLLCEVIVIDEIGFLELEKHSGWSQAFQVLEGENYKIAFIVVRPDLIDIALSKWENAQVIELRDKDDRDAILSSILNQAETILAK